MRVTLVIIDGWGVAPPSLGNAITSARTPTINRIEQNYPSLLLQASGIAVGLPWGEAGNSEVGHLNLGAGRIVLQYIPRIFYAIRDGSFFSNPALKAAIEHVKKNNSSLHLMGLASSGSVHSYIDHLYALLEFAKREEITNVFLHLFTDGKDSPPNEAKKFIEQLKNRLEEQRLGKIATIIGRSYAMDRNENWGYTHKTYELLTEGKGQPVADLSLYLEKSYEDGINDQYIEPAAIMHGNQSIKDGDAIIFFNFREDSTRQLTHAFIDEEFNNFPRKKISDLKFIAMTHYFSEFPRENVAFLPPDISKTLAETLSQHGKRQLHIAETEKYAHVTYFFNGLQEKNFPGEERVFIPSFAASTYEQQPQMRAEDVTEKALRDLNNFDFILLNFANPDMLAHTGNLQATIKGVEIIDVCIKKLLDEQDDDTALIITSDHGHAEQMFDLKSGTIKTQHTTNPVPLYFVIKNKKGHYPEPLVLQPVKGVLGDVAPTVLEIMGLPIPAEMTGQSLL